MIGGGTDPAAAPSARPQLAPGWNGWNGIQITHRGSLGFKNVDDLFAHQPARPDLYVYRNSGTGGLLDGTAPVDVPKPAGCATPGGAALDCAAHGYGADWSKTTQIAAFGSLSGDTAKDGALGRTSLLFVENGRLWLVPAGTTNNLADRSVLLSPNDNRWDGYELITPGRAQGTDLPTLWARSKADGSLHAFSVKGTAQAPDLTGFGNPAGGVIGGRSTRPAIRGSAPTGTSRETGSRTCGRSTKTTRSSASRGSARPRTEVRSRIPRQPASTRHPTSSATCTGLPRSGS
ncbi:hypothetical protein [Streptomyces globosus]|uniref:hypothetical protein n=1 Tax=Streptomyces globosus TaxID=68209 RepID=UPI00364313CA